MIEIIVGMIDEGEMLEVVCYWEFMEEVGIRLDGLIKVLSYLFSFGGIIECLYIYVVKIDVILV